jgi:hypothetical protein
MTAARISEVLGVKPSDSKEMGDRISRMSDRRAVSAWWALDCPSSWLESMESQIGKMLEPLEHLPQKSLSEISSCCKMEIVCSFSPDDGQGSVVLSSGVLGRLSALGVDVLINFWTTGSVSLPS